MNIQRFRTAYQQLSPIETEEDARLVLELTRWDDGPQCPVCGADDGAIRQIKANPSRTRREGLLVCTRCKPKRQFTVTTHTELANFKLSMLLLVQVIHDMDRYRDKLSVRGVARMAGFSEETAQKLCVRIRKEFSCSFGFVKNPNRDYESRVRKTKKRKALERKVRKMSLEAAIKNVPREILIKLIS